MKSGMMKAASRVAAAMMCVACGGAPKEPAQGANGAGGAGAGGGAQADASTEGAAMSVDAGPAQPPPPEHPFAKTAAEATGLIDDAIMSRAARLNKCVEDVRARRKDPHAKVQVEIGIDQEGTLLGVKTPKGQTEDKGFNDCVQNALTKAPFPRSHAGVITVKKTFEDQVVYK
jgi:hypothetical protein